MNFENKLAHPAECHCLSWKPVFAGALTGLGLTFLLKLFGIAIGLTAFKTTGGTETLVFGGLLGTTIGVVASMFAAGWIAGYLGARHCSKRHLGALYGFLTWCLTLVALVLLMGPMVHYVIMYGHLLSGYPMDMATAPINSVITNTNEQATTSVMVSAYVLFGLFFLSAFSSSIGGHCGMQHRCKSE